MRYLWGVLRDELPIPYILRLRAYVLRIGDWTRHSTFRERANGVVRTCGRYPMRDDADSNLLRRVLSST